MEATRIAFCNGIKRTKENERVEVEQGFNEWIGLSKNNNKNSSEIEAEERW